MNEISILVEKKIFQNQKIHAADVEITNIFSFKILDGSLNRFNTQKQTVLLSSQAAHHFFGTNRATGRKIKIYSLGDTIQFSVAAVYEDYPQNSHEEFNIFMRFDTLSIQSLRFNPMEAGLYGRVFYRNMTYYEKFYNNLFKAKDINYQFQPLSEIYLGPRVLGGDTNHGDLYSIIILISLTSLILFLAITSFINLTALTLPNRSTELAVKKLAGSSKLNLLFTFAQESFSIVGISLVAGILLLFFTTTWIEPALAINLISLLTEGKILFILIMIGLFLILGIAPLFMTYKFAKATPIRLLSTDTITFPRFKKIITVLQLGISIFLIVASIVINRQVNYSLVKEPGRNYDQIVYLNYPKDLTSQDLRNLRLSWRKNNPNIDNVIATSQLPNRISSKELDSDFYFISVDPYFQEVFDLTIVRGNWFGANDGDSIMVVNEKGWEMLGSNTKNVIGTFKDLSGQFNQPEKPIKINIAPHFNYNFLCVRVLEVDIQKTVRYLSTYFGSRTQPAKISFMNKRFERWLKYQAQLNNLSKVLAIISGLLSCCAIYGLSVSLVRDKLKQIAIHKICGASVLNITYLLVQQFTRQMLIAIVIFGPLTYIIIKEILRNFVYSTEFKWLDLLYPLVYCAIIIILLCSFQASSLNRADLSSSLKG